MRVDHLARATVYQLNRLIGKSLYFENTNRLCLLDSETADQTRCRLKCTTIPSIAFPPFCPVRSGEPAVTDMRFERVIDGEIDDGMEPQFLGFWHRFD